MSVNVRIEKTGESFDVEPDGGPGCAMAVWFVLERAGIISYPSKEKAAEKKKGVAAWSVQIPTSGESGMPVVVAHCPGCGAKQIFSDPPRQLKIYETEKSNSPMRNCKLEHCGRTDRITEAIFDEFYEVLNGVRR